MPGLKSGDVSLELPYDAAKLPHVEPPRADSGLAPVPMRRAPASLSAYRIRSSIRRGIGAVPKFADEELAFGGRVLFAPVALGFGAVVWFAAGTGVSPIIPLFSAMALFILLIFIDRALEGMRVVIAALILVAAGVAAAQFETWRADTILLDSAVTTTVTGRVERREGDGRGGWRYLLSLRATESPVLKRPPARVTVIARGAKSEFQIGTWVKGRARLTPPSGPALPALNDFSFGSFFDGVGANGFFYGAPAPVAPGVGEPHSLSDSTFEWLYRLRSGIGDRIRGILPGDTGAFAAALVTDERRAISAETTEALRRSGLAHIIAISGLNMALSAGIFFVGFRALLSLFPAIAQAYPVKKIAAAGALAAVTAYFLISGFAVSAERAFIMMAIMLTAVFFDRPSISLRNVALSALIIIVISPSEIMGPSFQMSFAATLALVAGYAIWKERPVRDKPFAKLRAVRVLSSAAGFFGGILLTSVIGGFSTALFSIEHFHRLTAYGLPANLAAMPVISFVIMPAGLLAMLLMPFGLDVWLWHVVGFGLDLVIAIAKTVASWGGDIGVGRLPAWYFLAAVAGFLLLTLLRTRLRHIGTTLMIAATLAVLLLPAKPPPKIVIAEDGSMAGIVGANAIATNRERPPGFIFDQWKRALVLASHREPIVVTSLSLPTAPPGERLTLTSAQQQEALNAIKANAREERFSCVKKAWCTAKLTNGSVLTVIDNAAYLGPACDASDIVVTPVRLRIESCRSGALLFTGASLRKTGSVELRFDGGAAAVTGSFENLDRPWTRHRAYDWRSGTFDGDGITVSDSGG